VHAADITNESDVQSAVSALVDQHGALDGIICSAGTSMPKLFEATTAEDWTWLLQLNIVGTRNVIAAALAHLKQSPAGRIVLVSSSAGQVGVFGFTAYSVSPALSCPPHPAPLSTLLPRRQASLH
jgi:NADP-dependent 3-hydroxy acid dehydrogenase YdfG